MTSPTKSSAEILGASSDENRVYITGIVESAPESSRTSAGRPCATLLLRVTSASRSQFVVRINAYEAAAEWLLKQGVGDRIRVKAELVSRTRQDGLVVLELKAWYITKV